MESMSPEFLEAAGQAGQILSDAFLAFGRINFVTGKIDVIKRDPRVPAPPFEGCTADDYARMLLRENIIHPDYANDYRFRSEADHLQKVFFSGERLRNIIVRTNNPNGIEWISFGIAACEHCSPENPWGAFYLLQEHVDMLPASVQRTFYETDSLTGALTRGRFKQDTERLPNASYKSIAVVYVDAIGLHETNNHLGHAKGDAMLKCIAHTLKDKFSEGSVYRIGGDEFVCLVPNMSEERAEELLAESKDLMGTLSVEVSGGVACTEDLSKLHQALEHAENRMRDDKAKYYESGDKNRRLRTLNEGLETIIREKKDIESLLGLVVSDDTSVYVVDTMKDVSRCITAPEEVRQYQHSGKDGFSDAMRFYAERGLSDEYKNELMKLVDYDWLRTELLRNKKVERTLKGLNGSTIKVIIVPYSDDPVERDLTIWMFETHK